MILNFSNRKGGVRKTTTTVNLAAALARARALGVDPARDYRVLVVDLDSQGNASTVLGAPAGPDDLTIADALIDGVPLADVIAPTHTPGLHVVPANDDIELRIGRLYGDPASENRLRLALERVRDLYDVVLIDCPPSIGLQWRMAMLAADCYLMPLNTDELAIEGVRRMFSLIRAQDRGDMAPILGLALVGIDYQLQDARPTERALRESMGDLVLTATVRKNHALDTAHRRRLSIFDHNPRATGAQDYRRLAREILERAARHGMLARATPEPA